MDGLVFTVGIKHLPHCRSITSRRVRSRTATPAGLEILQPLGQPPAKRRPRTPGPVATSGYALGQHGPRRERKGLHYRLRDPMNGEVPNNQQPCEAEPGQRETERRLATLLSNLPGMVYRCKNDRNWTMEFVSDGCEALTGYKAIDFVGVGARAYNSLIHPDDRERIWNEVQEAVGQGTPFRLTYRIHAADGREKWVWEQGVGVSAGADQEVLEGFITDITELK